MYVVLAGANDMLDDQPNMSVPVGSLQTSMEKLYTDGARQFLVINLPPLGYTPRYNGSQSTITTYNTRSQQLQLRAGHDAHEFEKLLIRRSR